MVLTGVTGLGHTTLRLCSPGTFKAAAGQHSCKRCPAGASAAKHGSVRCLPCPKGTQAIAAHAACGAMPLQAVYSIRVWHLINSMCDRDVLCTVLCAHYRATRWPELTLLAYLKRVCCMVS